MGLRGRLAPWCHAVPDATQGDTAVARPLQRAHLGLRTRPRVTQRAGARAPAGAASIA